MKTITPFELQMLIDKKNIELIDVRRIDGKTEREPTARKRVAGLRPMVKAKPDSALFAAYARKPIALSQAWRAPQCADFVGSRRARRQMAGARSPAHLGLSRLSKQPRVRAALTCWRRRPQPSSAS